MEIYQVTVQHTSVALEAFSVVTGGDDYSFYFIWWNMGWRERALYLSFRVLHFYPLRYVIYFSVTFNRAVVIEREKWNMPLFLF